MATDYVDKVFRENVVEKKELGIAGILHLAEGSVVEEVWPLHIVLVFVKYPV